MAQFLNFHDSIKLQKSLSNNMIKCHKNNSIELVYVKCPARFIKKSFILPNCSVLTSLVFPNVDHNNNNNNAVPLNDGNFDLTIVLVLCHMLEQSPFKLSCTCGSLYHLRMDYYVGLYAKLANTM